MKTANDYISRWSHQADTSTQPEVTICMCLYNAEEYVIEALDSAARQTLQPLSLIIVDDASTDRSLEKIIPWLKQHQNRFESIELGSLGANSGGPARPLNEALKNVTTPYVFILDSDNIIRPRCLEKLLTALKKSSAAFAYPILEKFGDETGLMGSDPWNVEYFQRGNYIDALTLIRRSALEKVQGYDEHSIIRGLQDYDLWLRFIRANEYGLQVPEILARYRVRTHSLIRDRKNFNQKTALDFLRYKHPWIRIQR